MNLIQPFKHAVPILKSEFSNLLFLEGFLHFSETVLWSYQNQKSNNLSDLSQKGGDPCDFRPLANEVIILRLIVNQP